MTVNIRRIHVQDEGPTTSSMQLLRHSRPLLRFLPLVLVVTLLLCLSSPACIRLIHASKHFHTQQQQQQSADYLTYQQPHDTQQYVRSSAPSSESLESIYSSSLDHSLPFASFSAPSSASLSTNALLSSSSPSSNSFYSSSDLDLWSTHSTEDPDAFSESSGFGSMMLHESLRREEQTMLYATTGAMNPGDPCAVGWMGSLCDQCSPGYYGSTCQACPLCVNGACRDGFTGDGGCTCQQAWYGSLCDSFQNSSLLPFPVSVSGLENSLLIVKFNATVLTPPFRSVVMTLPLNGSLYQTTDGTTTSGSAITVAPFNVSYTGNVVIYKPFSNSGTINASQLFDSFQYEVSNMNVGLVPSPANVSLYVQHRNVAPTLMLPPSNFSMSALQQGVVIVRTQFATAVTPYGFSFIDTDALPGSVMQMTLNVTYGNFSFSPAMSYLTGLLIYRGANDSSWVAQGNNTELQSILNELLYTPYYMYVGPDVLKIAVDDLGNSGYGGNRVSYGNVSISVVRVNQPINLVGQSIFNGTEDIPMNFTNALTIVDPDAFYGNITLEVHVNMGNFSLNTRLNSTNASMPFAIFWDRGNQNLTRHRWIQIKSDLRSLNTILSSMVYYPPYHFHSNVTMNVRVNDNGNSGLGLANEMNRTFTLMFAFVDYPPLTFNQNLTMRQAGMMFVTLTGDGIDEYAPLANLTFTITIVPPATCGDLYQVIWRASTNSWATGLPITANNTVVTDPGHQVQFKAKPYVSGTNLCRFKYSVTKPSGMTSIKDGRIGFNVIHVNNAPQCTGAQSWNVYEGHDRVITLGAMDPDQDTLSYHIDVAPTRGRLYQYVSAGSSTNSTRGALITGVALVTDPQHRVIMSNITSDGVAIGSIFATIDYSASDGQMSIIPSCHLVLPLSTPTIPLAPTVFITSIESVDTTVPFAIDYSQQQELNLTSVTIESMPPRGRLFLTEDGFTVGPEITASDLPYEWDDSSGYLFTLFFRPVPYESGKPYVTFNYSIIASNDMSSAIGPVTIDLIAVPHAPDAYSAEYTNLPPALDTMILCNATSRDGDNITIRIYQFPSAGTLYLLNGTEITSDNPYLDGFFLLYRPDPYTGPYPVWPDTFYFEALGGGLRSSPASIDVLIGGSALTPLVVNSTMEINEGSEAILTFNGTDLRGSRFPVVPYITDIVFKNNLAGLDNGRFVHPDGVDVDLSQGPQKVRLKTIVYNSPTEGFGLDFATVYYRVKSTPEGVWSGLGSVEISIVHQKSIPQASGGLVRFFEDQFMVLNLKGVVTDRPSLNATVYNLPDVGQLYTCLSQAPTVAPAIPDAFSAYSNVVSMYPYLGDPITTWPYYVATGCMGDDSTASVIYVPPLRVYGSEFLKGVMVSLTYSVFDGELLSPNNGTLRVVVDHVQYLPQSFGTNGNVTSNITISGASSASYNPAFPNPSSSFTTIVPEPAVPTYYTLENEPLLLSLQAFDVDGQKLSFNIKSVPTNGSMHIAVKVTDAVQDDIDFSEPYSDVIASTGYVLRRTPLSVDALIHSASQKFQDRENKVWYLPNKWYNGNDNFEFATLLPPTDQNPIDPRYSNFQSVPSSVNITVVYVEQPPQAPVDPVTIPTVMNAASFLALQAWDPQGKPVKFKLVSVPDSAYGVVYNIPDWVTLMTLDPVNNTIIWQGTPPTGWTQPKRSAYKVDDHYSRRVVTPSSYQGSTYSASDREAFFNEYTSNYETPYPDYYTSYDDEGFLSMKSPQRRLLAISVNTPLRDVDIPYPISDAIVKPANASSTWSADVTHPLGYIGFVPTFGASGSASIVYAPSNGNLVAAPITASINIPKVFQAPRALTFSKNIQGTENQPFVVRLYYTIDDSLPQRASVIQISGYPENGTLCEVTPRTGFPQPCGEAYGPSLSKGSPVVDPNERVAYLPGLNRWGNNFDSFSFQITDSTGAVSNAASIGFDIAFQNQKPVAQSDTPVVDFSSIDSYDITLNAADPDNTIDQLVFALTSAPTIGFLNVSVPGPNGKVITQWVNQTTLDDYFANHGSYTVVNDTTNGTLSTHRTWVPAKSFVLASRQMNFLAAGQGAAYPYASFTFSVTDPGSESTSGSISILVTCKSPLYPNVWSPGPVCYDCPTGAACSSVGLYRPRALAGYWQSQERVNSSYTVLHLTAQLQPVYLVCEPADACLAAGYGEDGCDGSVGYMGRRCAACQEGYHPVSGKCSLCNKNSSSYIVLGVIIVAGCLGGAGFLWLMSRLSIDVSFFAIAFNFLQTVGTFKNFKLDWPSSTSNAFGEVATALNFNPDLLSLECWMPETILGIPTKISYQYKWAIVMFLPFAIALLLIISTFITICGKLLFAKMNKLVSKKKKVSRSCCDEVKILAAKPLDVFYKAMITVLNIGFLALTLKALEMTKCTTQADGTELLDAASYLLCNDSWYPPWYRLAIIMCAVYAVGIPVYVSIILFIIRPINNTVQYGPFRLPPNWVGYTVEHVALLRASKRDEVSMFGDPVQRSSEMATFMARYEGLTRIYNRDYFYWSLVVMLRNLGLSLIAVLLSGTPLYQCILAMILLFVMLILQVWCRPYVEAKKFNELEQACLTSEIMVLFIGLTYFVRLDDSFVQANLHDPSTRYPFFTEVMGLMMNVAVLACGVVICILLYEQMKVPMANLSNWRKQRNERRASLVANGASSNQVERIKSSVDPSLKYLSADSVQELNEDLEEMLAIIVLQRQMRWTVWQEKSEEEREEWRAQRKKLRELNENSLVGEGDMEVSKVASKVNSKSFKSPKSKSKSHLRSRSRGANSKGHSRAFSRSNSGRKLTAEELRSKSREGSDVEEDDFIEWPVITLTEEYGPRFHAPTTQASVLHMMAQRRELQREEHERKLRALAQQSAKNRAAIPILSPATAAVRLDPKRGMRKRGKPFILPGQFIEYDEDEIPRVRPPTPTHQKRKYVLYKPSEEEAAILQDELRQKEEADAAAAAENGNEAPLVDLMPKAEKPIHYREIALFQPVTVTYTKPKPPVGSPDAKVAPTSPTAVEAKLVEPIETDATAATVDADAVPSSTPDTARRNGKKKYSLFKPLPDDSDAAINEAPLVDEAPIVDNGPPTDDQADFPMSRISIAKPGTFTPRVEKATAVQDEDDSFKPSMRLHYNLFKQQPDEYLEEPSLTADGKQKKVLSARRPARSMLNADSTISPSSSAPNTARRTLNELVQDSSSQLSARSQRARVLQHADTPSAVNDDVESQAKHLMPSHSKRTYRLFSPTNDDNAPPDATVVRVEPPRPSSIMTTGLPGQMFDPSMIDVTLDQGSYESPTLSPNTLGTFKKHGGFYARYTPREMLNVPITGHLTSAFSLSNESSPRMGSAIHPQELNMQPLSPSPARTPARSPARSPARPAPTPQQHEAIIPSSPAPFALAPGITAAAAPPTPSVKATQQPARALSPFEMKRMKRSQEMQQRAPSGTNSRTRSPVLLSNDAAGASPSNASAASSAFSSPMLASLPGQMGEFAFSPDPIDSDTSSTSTFGSFRNRGGFFTKDAAYPHVPLTGSVPLHFYSESEPTSAASPVATPVTSQSTTTASRRVKNSAGKYTLYNPSPETPELMNRNKGVRTLFTPTTATQQPSDTGSAASNKGRRTLFTPEPPPQEPIQPASAGQGRGRRPLLNPSPPETQQEFTSIESAAQSKKRTLINPSGEPQEFHLPGSASKYTLYNPSPDVSSDALDSFTQQRGLNSAPPPRAKRTLFSPEQTTPPMPLHGTSHGGFDSLAAASLPPTAAASTVLDIAATPPISPTITNTRSFQQAIDARAAAQQPTVSLQVVDQFPMPLPKPNDNRSTSPSKLSPTNSVPGSAALPSRALRARALQREIPHEKYEQEASILSSLVSNQPSLFSPLGSLAEGYHGISSTEVSRNSRGSLESLGSSSYLPGQTHEDWESYRSTHSGIASPNPLSSVRNNVKTFDFNANGRNSGEAVHHNSRLPSQQRLRLDKSMSEGGPAMTPADVAREILSGGGRPQSKGKYSLFRPHSVEPFSAEDVGPGSPQSGPIAGRRGGKHTLFHPADSPYASQSSTPSHGRVVPDAANAKLQQQKKSKHTLFKPVGEIANQPFF